MCTTFRTHFASAIVIEAVGVVEPRAGASVKAFQCWMTRGDRVDMRPFAFPVQ